MASSSSSPSNYLLLFLLSQFLINCCSEVSSISELRKLGPQVTSFPSNRHLLNHLKSTVNDDNVFPTPGTQTLTPTTVTVSPVMVTPTNPTTTPVSVPAMTPVIFPQTAPPVPLTVPVTNPVTTYPSPPNFSGTTPVNPPPASTYNPVIPPTTPYNPVGPPVTTTAPAVSGQSWCVAKGGVTEQALQSALDYACGIGGADCSQIQMGSSCYSPITLQNHASYAFNSYYQKNPTATSCDFGGVAAVVSTNPSTGSCIFPSGSTSTTPTPVTTPIVPTPTTDSSSSSSPAGVPVPTSSTGTPPNLFNTGSPTSGFGYGNPPPPFGTDISVSAKTQPRLGCLIVLLVISAATEMMLRI